MVLCSFILYFRDKVKHLIENNIQEVGNYEWKKELKFYRNEGHGL